MEWRCCPQALDGLLKKFYVEIRKKDGTDYEPDSLRVIQAAIDRYLGHKKYPVHRPSQGGSWGARDPPFVSLLVSKQLTIFRWQSDEYPLYESVWPPLWKILATPTEWAWITGCEFTKSQETLDAKAKQLRRQGKGKRSNKAQAYSETADEEIFCGEGKCGNDNALASTNVNFKNLSETMGFRGRQDHYDAYVEDFSIFQNGSKVVEFKGNSTKTRQGGL